MARKKKESLVHVDLETLSEEVKDKKASKRADEADKTLGELLRQTRERKRYHLETIAKRLKIKPIYLEALEKGHYYAFPGLVYGIGFLRSYAQFLGLDVKDVMDRFHAETSGIKSQPLEMPIPENKNILPSGKTIVKSLLFIIIIYLIWYIANSFLQPTVQPVKPILQPVVTTEPLVEESVVPEKVVEKPVVSMPLVVVKKEPVKKKEVVEPVRQPVVHGLEKPAVISFIATDKTWIEVTDTDSNQVVLSQILYAGDSYNPPEDSKNYVLKTDNAGGVDAYINNRKIVTLGKKGELKSDIAITKKALRKL